MTDGVRWLGRADGQSEDESTESRENRQIGQRIPAELVDDALQLRMRSHETGSRLGDVVGGIADSLLQLPKALHDLKDDFFNFFFGHQRETNVKSEGRMRLSYKGKLRLKRNIPHSLNHRSGSITPQKVFLQKKTFEFETKVCLFSVSSPGDEVGGGFVKKLLSIFYIL